MSVASRVRGPVLKKAHQRISINHFCVGQGDELLTSLDRLSPASYLVRGIWHLLLQLYSSSSVHMSIWSFKCLLSICPAYDIWEVSSHIQMSWNYWNFIENARKLQELMNLTCNSEYRRTHCILLFLIEA